MTLSEILGTFLKLRDLSEGVGAELDEEGVLYDEIEGLISSSSASSSEESSFS